MVAAGFVRIIVMNISNYEKFLDFIMDYINGKFEQQKEYISCSKGCDLCCKTIGVPFSKLEFEYLIEGYKQLDDKTKMIVDNKIKQLINNESEKECPFLIDNVCSVYKYRGIICRTLGLMTFSNIDGKDEYNIPFCVHKGLNYAKVYDSENNKISEEKVRELGYKEEPKFYALDRSILFNLKLVKDLELDFGESKRLIDWLKGFSGAN